MRKDGHCRVSIPLPENREGCYYHWMDLEGKELNLGADEATRTRGRRHFVTAAMAGDGRKRGRGCGRGVRFEVQITKLKGLRFNEEMI
jgi:hypothetical protein